MFKDVWVKKYAFILHLKFVSAVWRLRLKRDLKENTN